MTLGQTIREARKKKKWNLRQLAEEMTNAGAKINFTYLSRVENDTPEYPLSEEKIRILARILDLDEEELIVAAGKYPEELIKAMRNNPEVAEQVVLFFRKMKQNQHDEK
jgi:transcriptional regulator with XRE-family HTH domain